MQICTIVFSYTALTASGRPLSLSSSALVVVLAGDVLAPAGLGPFVAGDGFGGGRAGYEVVGCGAVPVSFARRGTGGCRRSWRRGPASARSCCCRLLSRPRSPSSSAGTVTLAPRGPGTPGPVPVTATGR